MPDIRLADYSSKDSVIYTNNNYVGVWYKSCGERALSLKYDPCYILTGDEQERNFYNLFVATVAVLNQRKSGLASVSILRERFCKEYHKNNESEGSISDIEERFNKAFSKASDKRIIVGRYWKETYFCSFREIDLVGLEPYQEIAEHYADVVLQQDKGKDGTAYSKKMVPNAINKKTD